MDDRINYITYAPEAIIVPLICFMLCLILEWAIGQIIIIVIFVVLLAFYRGRNWHLNMIDIPNVHNPLKNILLSPCDGKVIKVVHHSQAIQVAIFLNVHNIHVQYAPIDGTIKSIMHKDGEFVPAYMFEKSEYNERVETMIHSEFGNITVIQIAGQVARRIRSFHKPNIQLKRGEPMGLIKFGSRVDVWIPRSNADTILVKEGDYVQIGNKIAILRK